jgi:hypothetical protein
MAGIMVPKAKMEAPTTGDTPFAEGDFIGVIEEVRIRTFPDWIDPSQNRGYASTDGEIVSIQLGSNTNTTPGGANVGGRKMFVDFVTRDGDVEVSAGPDIPEASWQMQRGATMLARLAAALGATEEVELDEETYVTTSDDFLDTLRAGGFNGQKVGFTVAHRKWTSKDKTKTGTEASVREFFQAV